MINKLHKEIEGSDDIGKQRDYWFYVANNYIDFVDWICDNKLTGYDTSELLKEFGNYRSLGI
jgi:hypothetical protein